MKKSRKMRKPPIFLEPILRDNLLKLATVCARIRQIKLNTLSGEAHGDPKFFDKLMAGQCSFTIRKYDSTIRWFDENWPAETPKPAITELFPKRDKAPA